MEVGGAPPVLHIFENTEYGCFKKKMLDSYGKPKPQFLESDDVDRYEHKVEKMQIPLSGKNGDYVV